MSVTLDIRGLPEVRSLLEQFSEREVNNRTRRAMRAGIAQFRKAYRGRGVAPAYPRTMRATRTRAHRNPMGVSLTSRSPLAPIFDKGARPHAIPIGRGPLAGRVFRHPGMAPRPITVPVFDEADDAARRAFEETFFEGVR